MIPNAIVRNNSITNTSKMIYMSLRINLNINQTQLFCSTSINGLLNTLGFKQRSENQNMIKESIVELEKIGAISIYYDLLLSKITQATNLKGNAMFFVKFSDEFVYSEMFLKQFKNEEVDKELIASNLTYTTVYVDDAAKLLSTEFKHNRANIISFYLVVVSRALIGNMGHKYSIETIQGIIQYANIDEKTVSKYILTLFEAKILFKLTLREQNNKGEIRDHNVYSRWCDRHIVTFHSESNTVGRKLKIFKIGDKVLTENSRINMLTRLRNLYTAS